MSTALVVLVAAACSAAVPSGLETTAVTPVASSQTIGPSATAGPTISLPDVGPASSLAAAAANIAPLARVTVLDQPDAARNAVDGNGGTQWTSGRVAPGWFALSYDQPYQVERIEMVVAQSPPGNTIHEIWLGNGPDLQFLTRLAGNTSDGQTLLAPVSPPQLVTRVLIRTSTSPSFVGWREVRVFGASAPQPPGASLKLTPFLTGGRIDHPTNITHAGDGSGRIFINQQEGRVWVVNANGERRSQPFLEIPERVGCCNERALLGLAFPPGYAQKRYFYVSYTSTARPDLRIALGDDVISRFRLAADADAGNPRSEEIILVIPQASDAHHGGKMEFGRDGYLYVTVGDGGPGGGAEGRAQRTDNLQGKLLRIDVEAGQTPYAIPSSNPFVGRDGYRPEIWSLGLRNPWGMTIDLPTGNLYIADAGENEWEEIDVQRRGDAGGENYGWPRMEGRHCYPQEGCDMSGLTLPVTEYHHLEGCAEIGGAVARGSRYRQLQGWYLYGDFCSGRIWGLREEDGRWIVSVVGEPGFPISSMGRDEAGNLYVADYAHGAIYLIGE